MRSSYFSCRSVAQLVLLRDQRGKVDLLGPGLEPRERMVACRAVDLAGAKQRLRGYTANVHAGAAGRAALDDRHARALIARPDRRGESGRPAADDDEVVLIGGRARSRRRLCRLERLHASGGIARVGDRFRESLVVDLTLDVEQRLSAPPVSRGPGRPGAFESSLHVRVARVARHPADLHPEPAHG